MNAVFFNQKKVKAVFYQGFYEIFEISSLRIWPKVLVSGLKTLTIWLQVSGVTQG